jgi:hypothetical protein
VDTQTKAQTGMMKMSLFVIFQGHYDVIICKTVKGAKIGPGSSVGTAPGYGLDGPGIESRCGRDFPHLS